MFTGLIEEQGTIKSCTKSSEGMEITIKCSKILSDIEKGASICVDGACQSVIDFGSNYIKVQASNETLKDTNFKNLKEGTLVNLERALTLNKKIAGHIVSGHVDCTAEFVNSIDDGFSKKLFFKLPKEYTKYVIYKGSVAVNGVSLTVASINNDIFSVELIPLTLKEANLSSLKSGEIVNIETDLFAKYVEKIFSSKDNTSNINYGFLTENGFI
ncbi:MAG: riboflavin synthase [Candidatus Gastranaerophilales bacterium]|nr:riboflavin synthase [Candidatus Gastranaerophilales bacterium]